PYAAFYVTSSLSLHDALPICKNIAFAGLVKTVFLLPMVVPAVIMGVGMQIVFSKIGLSSSFLGVVIAHTLGCIPFVHINVLASLDLQSTRLNSSHVSISYAVF